MKKSVAMLFIICILVIQFPSYILAEDYDHTIFQDAQYYEYDKFDDSWVCYSTCTEDQCGFGVLIGDTDVENVLMIEMHANNLSKKRARIKQIKFMFDDELYTVQFPRDVNENNGVETVISLTGKKGYDFCKAFSEAKDISYKVYFEGGETKIIDNPNQIKRVQEFMGKIISSNAFDYCGINAESDEYIITPDSTTPVQVNPTDEPTPLPTVVPTELPTQSEINTDDKNKKPEATTELTPAPTVEPTSTPTPTPLPTSIPIDRQTEAPTEEPISETTSPAVDTTIDYPFSEQLNPSVQVTDFSIHKGLKFGITEDEAREFEEKTNGTYFKGYNEYSGMDALWGKTSFINNSMIIMSLSFDENNKLVSVTFENKISFSKDYYNEINQTLSSKYGENIASGFGYYTQMPTKGIDAIRYVTSDGFLYTYDSKTYEEKNRFKKLSYDDVAEYVVKIDNGYVVIYTVLISYDADGIQAYDTVISYSYFSGKDYDDMIASRNEKEHEKEEYEKQKEESRNDDL